MEEMLYRPILRQAWALAWKHKRLWVLGFLALFWGDLGAYQTFNQALDRFNVPTLVKDWSVFVAPFEGLEFGQFALILGLSLVVLAVGAVLLTLVTAARGGLLWSLAQSSKIARQENNAALLKRGWRAFFPLLGIGILTRVDLIFYWGVLNPLVTQEPSSLTFTLFLLAFVLVTLFSLMLSFLGIYAAALVMLEGQTLKGAVRGALVIFARHWLVSLELALILYFVTLLVGLGVLAVLFALGLPLLLLGSIAVFLKFPILLWIIVAVGAVAYLAFLFLAGSAFVTFQYAAWVLLFLRIREQNATAKIVRLTARFGHLLHRKVV